MAGPGISWIRESNRQLAEISPGVVVETAESADVGSDKQRVCMRESMPDPSEEGFTVSFIASVCGVESSVARCAPCAFRLLLHERKEQNASTLRTQAAATEMPAIRPLLIVESPETEAGADEGNAGAEVVGVLDCRVVVPTERVAFDVSDVVRITALELGNVEVVCGLRPMS